jgi:hypothetical protein
MKINLSIAFGYFVLGLIGLANSNVLATPSLMTKICSDGIGLATATPGWGTQSAAGRSVQRGFRLRSW